MSRFFSRLSASLVALALFVTLIAPRAFALAPWVHETPQAAGDFPLVQARQAAVVLVSAEDHEVARVAAADFSADVERVTGLRPLVSAQPLPAGGPVVLIGTLGRNAFIDDLAARGRLDVSALRGAWESFVITTIDAPVPGVASALVVVGSDRRGTAFGVYELSQAIGVSPWYWWADVTPERKSGLHIAAGTRRFGPPSVQYRGIFLNDEDWGLQPWAAKTFEPEVGDIGPKTYAKICELLLRLKANTLWPAMHACTQAFNHYPENKLVADRYAIVMGSSHAEPMLRNNVTEWTAPKEAYDYVHNRDGVHAYWEQRVRENGKFENIYTLGMRGIHDSNMVGPKTDAERIATLEQIFADQRAMIARHVKPTVEQVPQMFCAYKEVLDLYRQGLKVPDDVTIVWPDDNFGYIRNFATPEEQKRSGGFGVYYHLSYLGRPLSYLWLNTTPPALIWSEMHKAYEHGARKIWIVNVGDLKPAEIGTEFFLQMAWDINRWNADNLDRFLPEWAEREFGAEYAASIAESMKRYYAINFERRPEHLQWWLPKDKPAASPLSRLEISNRLAAAMQLDVNAQGIGEKLPATKQNAFFQLVRYPATGAWLANARYFYGELGDREKAETADRELTALNRDFNERLSGGKWRGFMSLEPANDEWKSMRIAPWTMPDFADAPRSEAEANVRERIWGSTAKPGRDSRWKALYPLGQALLPTTAPIVSMEEAATLNFTADVSAPGDYQIDVQLLPTHPIVAGRGLRIAIGLNDEPPRLLTYTGKDGSPEWAQGVLNNYVTVSTTLTLPTAGKHVVRLYGLDPGVVVRALFITRSAAPRTLPIAANAFAGSSVNVLANQSSTLLTHGDHQYAAFYDADQRLVLARRALAFENWETVVTPYSGRAHDAHNTIALGIDGAGFLHVAWDHHGDPLNYARGVAPGSLELGPKQPMTGSLETRVTYPQFFTAPDGGLFFFYRDGRSGGGNVVLNRFDAKNAKWTQVQRNLLDGEGVRNAYFAVTVDARGTLHLAWNWRESPDVATNHDLAYARSTDGGVTWTTIAGAPLALPINAATADYALRIPQASKLMNPPSLATDEVGRPFIVSYWTPAGSDVPQFHVVHHDGQRWQTHQITQRTQPFELRGSATKRPPISRAAILARRSLHRASDTTELHLVYRDDEKGGRIVYLTCSDLGADSSAWTTRELTTESVGAWEPSLDLAQWRRFGQIHLLVQTVEQRDGNDTHAAPAAPTPISTLMVNP